MTSRRGEVTLRVGANITGALNSLDRLRQNARRVARDIDNASLGSAGRAGRIGGGIGRGIGRGGIGVGGVALAGFGAQAGFAIFEQVVEKMLELFEDTPILEEFTDALDLIFKVLGPLVGVLLQALTPALQALEPALYALVPALAPLIEIFGVTLYTAVRLLVPVIEFLAPLIQKATESLRTFVVEGIQWMLEEINKVIRFFGGEGIDLGFLEEFAVNTLDRAKTELAEAERLRELEDRVKSRTRGARTDSRRERRPDEPPGPESIARVDARVIIDGQTVSRSIQRHRTRRMELGGIV